MKPTRDEERQGRKRLDVGDDRRTKPSTFEQEFHRRLSDLLEEQGAVDDEDRWPDPSYQDDPVRFAREVLGVEPWERQREILESVRDHQRTAVSTARRIGKSYVAAMILLWFYCSFPRARVICTATTVKQVDEILWLAVTVLWEEAKKRIGGKLSKLARTGLKSDDHRQAFGLTAKQPEAFQGYAGANLLFIVDEASGVDDLIYRAIDGNLAGGGKVLLIGNPTRNEGEHFEAIRGNRQSLYNVIHVAAAETPNAVSGQRTIPGLADRSWIESERKTWGEDSEYYIVHVLGRHCLREESKIISFHDLQVAKARWEETAGEGRLVIGVDPAGPGGAGDESGFAARRGKRIGFVHGRRGLTEDAHLVEVLGLCSMLRKPEIDDRERPLVVIDRDGPIGVLVSRVFGAYVAMNENNPARAFDLVEVRSGERAKHKPNEFPFVRDEMWWTFGDWIKNGGAIPSDALLEHDLHEPRWERDAANRARATPKYDIRKRLGRSPDRGDACVLSTYVQGDYSDLAAATVQAQARQQREEEAMRMPTLDPWSSLDAWDPRRRR